MISQNHQPHLFYLFIVVHSVTHEVQSRTARAHLIFFSYCFFGGVFNAFIRKLTVERDGKRHAIQIPDFEPGMLQFMVSASNPQATGAPPEFLISHDQFSLFPRIPKLYQNPPHFLCPIILSDFTPRDHNLTGGVRSFSCSFSKPLDDHLQWIRKH